MRSPVVRVVLVLTFVLMVALVWMRVACAPDRGGSAPVPSVRAAAGFSPRVVVRTVASYDAAVEVDPAFLLMRSYAVEVESLDQETSGAFSQALRAVLSDPNRSVSMETFRLPAREGIDAIMATIPGAVSGYEEEHDRRLFIFLAAAIASGETDEDRARNVGVLAERYQLLPSRQ